MSELLRRPGIRAVLVLLGLALFFWALYALRDPLTPFAVALALAYFLNPLVNGMERVFVRALGRAPAAVRNRLDARMLAVGLLAFTVLLRNLYLRSEFYRGQVA